MWKAAELSCTSMLWWKQRLCTCQAASNLSPWRHLLYPVTRSEERKLVRDITEKEAGQRQSSARFSPVYCSDVRICWRCWKKTELWATPCSALVYAQGLQVHPADISWVPCIFSLISWGNGTYAIMLSMCGCRHTWMHVSVPPSFSSRNSDCFQPYLREHWWS